MSRSSYKRVLSSQELCYLFADDACVTKLETAFGKHTIFLRGNELEYRGELRKAFDEVLGELEVAVIEGRELSLFMLDDLLNLVKDDNLEKCELLRSLSIEVPQGKRVYPRNVAQYEYMKSMERRDMVFGIGPAGTGKTYLAVARALADVLSKKKKKMVLTRPVVEAGETLGYLPGDLSQKISPYLRPLYDAMESILPYAVIRRMEENHLIEVAPLAYMRGRSIENAVIILDEAQNTTPAQMKMFLTRIAEGSQTIITGDITQIDLPAKQPSGLIEAMHILSPIDDIYFHHFSSKHVVRSALVQKIVQAYEQNVQV